MKNNTLLFRGLQTSALLLALGVLLVLAGGWTHGPTERTSRSPRVVATTTVIGDLVRQIGGEQVKLVVLMGPGVDPHTYKPSTSDMGQLARARRIFYNGLHLEGKMVELFEHRLSDRAIPVTRDISPGELLPWRAGQAGAYDPHVWFDVRLWQHAARTVAQELSQIDPPNAPVYQQRLAGLLGRMDELHQYVQQQAARIPPERRVVITSHDAFNYFGRAYGFEVRGLQGISTETEAGLANIRDAVDFIIARQIPALFVESSVSPKTIQRVRDDCAARGVPVSIGGELYSDAMGAPGERPGYPVETYDGMVRYNIDRIVHALTEQRQL